MFVRGRQARSIAILAAGAWLFAAPALAQTRIATDDALRSGMAAIRGAVIDHHTLITHRRLPVARAKMFAADVSRDVAAIRSKTDVGPQSRAVLEPILTDIETGAQTIGAGGDSIRQMDALFAMTKALEAYGAAFEHPDWKPIQER